MNDFARVRAMMAFLRGAGASRRPDFDASALAAVAGTGPEQARRLFVRHVGVPPKVYARCLAFADARERLARGSDLLRAAFDAGLSGPGRLHDLFVTMEAVSPGEWKRGGDGMIVEWGTAPTILGEALFAWTARGLSHLAFIDGDDSDPMARVRRAWPGARWRRDDAEAAAWSARVFAPNGSEERTELRAFVRGTPFQTAVWRALMEIPEGTLASYGTLAAVLGRGGAGRAVGTAVGANPLAVLIPCHRVVRADGAMGGYRWGLDRKTSLLAAEFART